MPALRRLAAIAYDRMDCEFLRRNGRVVHGWLVEQGRMGAPYGITWNKDAAGSPIIRTDEVRDTHDFSCWAELVETSGEYDKRTRSTVLPVRCTVVRSVILVEYRGIETLLLRQVVEDSLPLRVYDFRTW